MNKYDKVKRYYEAGYWDRSRVRNAVAKRWITEEEYEEITGGEYAEAYPPERNDT